VFRRCVVTVLVVAGLSGVAPGERWLIERGRSASKVDGTAAEAATELLLRSKLAELRGVTLLSKADVKWDVATLELVRLSSARGKTRVTLGRFARARALIAADILGVPGREGFTIRLRVIDLSRENREQTFKAKVDPPGVEAAVAKVVPEAAKFLGRTPTPEELARINRSTSLSADALAALARSVDAKTPAERQLFTKLATTHAPEAPLAWYLHARALHASGQTLEAVSAYRRAIKLDDRVTAYHYDLGNAFFDGKRYAEAAAEYQRAIALDATHGASHANLVRAWQGQGKKPAAVVAAYAEMMGERFETLAVVQLQAGRLTWEMKKPAEAVAAFRKAVSLDAADPVLHFNLAHALERTGKTTEAVDEYAKAIALAPNYAKAHNNLACLYEGKGKPTLALFHYQQAVKYAPDYALAWNNLGILYGKRGKHRLEAEAFKKQARLTPGDAVAWFNLGVAWHRLRQYRSAINAYRKSLELKPDDKLTHWNLAQAYERLSVWNLANEHWHKVLKLAPTEKEKTTAERHIAENRDR